MWWWWAAVPPGIPARFAPRSLALKVALIDANDRLGGTCLLWGCIPTKAMLFTAEIWDHLKHADRYGIDVAEPKINWKDVLARKDDVITRHTKGLDFLMKKNKITTFKGFGRLTGPAKDGVHTVEVKLADGKAETVKAKKVVLATGSDARMLPGYKADDTILTNFEILKIDGDAEVAGGDRFGCSGRGVCVDLQELRRRGHHSGDAAPHGAGGG